MMSENSNSGKFNSESARQAGIKSGEKRREQKEFRDILKMAMEFSTQQNMTIKEAICKISIDKALAGDIEARDWICRMLREPTNMKESIALMQHEMLLEERQAMRSNSYPFQEEVYKLSYAAHEQKHHHAISSPYPHQSEMYFYASPSCITSKKAPYETPKPLPKQPMNNNTQSFSPPISSASFFGRTYSINTDQPSISFSVHQKEYSPAQPQTEQTGIENTDRNLHSKPPLSKRRIPRIIHKRKKSPRSIPVQRVKNLPENNLSLQESIPQQNVLKQTVHTEKKKQPQTTKKAPRTSVHHTSSKKQSTSKKSPRSIPVQREKISDIPNSQRQIQQKNFALSPVDKKTIPILHNCLQIKPDCLVSNAKQPALQNFKTKITS